MDKTVLGNIGSADLNIKLENAVVLKLGLVACGAILFGVLLNRVIAKFI